MLIDIRGGLGMQLLETFSAFTKYGEDNIETIRLNVGGMDDRPYLKRLFILDIFPELEEKYNFEIVNGFEKQNSFSYEGFAQAFEYANYHYSLSEWDKSNSDYFHIRKLDRQLLSDESYEKIRQRHNLEVIESDANTDPVERWQKLLAARKIIGQPSTFTLSTLLFYKDKELIVFPQSMCDGADTMSDEAFKTIEQIMTIFPNLKWYS